MKEGNEIKKFKIFGERNTGTNYIMQLIKKNIPDLEYMAKPWKHSCSLNGKGDDDTLYIFTFRSLDAWLKSMYNSPYHINKKDNFLKFISTNLWNPDEGSSKCKFIKEDYNNIFELRYDKFIKSIETSKKVNNYILVNLTNLQKQGGKKLIDIIYEKFRKDINYNFIDITKHTKCKKNVNDINYSDNIIYDKILYNKIKEKYINKDIENFIDSMVIII